MFNRNFTISDNATTKNLTNESGASLVEFSIVIGLLFFIIAAVVDLGLAYASAHSLKNFSRDAARVASMLQDLSDTQSTDPRLNQAVEDRAAQIKYLDIDNVSYQITSGNDIITGQLVEPYCDRQVTVTVTGHYNYVLLPAFGFQQNNLTSRTTMRWNNGALCPVGP